MAWRRRRVKEVLDEDDDVEYSFALEYCGPPVPYAIPKVIPLEVDQIPVAFAIAVPPSSVPDASAVPVVHPLRGPDSTTTREKGRTKTKPQIVVVSPTSVIDREGSGESASGSSAEASGELLPAVDFPADSEHLVTKSDSSSLSSIDQEGYASLYHQRSPAAVTFQGASSPPPLGNEDLCHGLDRRQKKGSCYSCGRGNRFTPKETCLVCNAKFCRRCIFRAMGSMSEGRKCVTCVGLPIDESKRDSLGRCSRLLRGLLNSLEVQQAMRSEKCSEANQLRPEYVIVNKKPLTAEEMVVLLTCKVPPRKLKPGRYWYDKMSGLWGEDGHKPHKIISPNLNVGGRLQEDASKGNTGVSINGRVITKSEFRMLQVAGVQCEGNPNFWLYDDGSYEEEGQKNIKGNLWNKTRTKLACSVLSLPLPQKVTNSPKEEPNDILTSVVPEYIGQRSIQKLLLIGCRGSGSSTIFEQAKFLYKPIAFPTEERESMKIMIQRNIYRYLGIILEGRELFEEECLSGVESNKDDLQTPYSLPPRLKDFSDWLLEVIASGTLEAFFPASCRENAPLVKQLWRNTAIQATYNRRSELRSLPRVASYFLERVLDISRPEYEPSDLDILYADEIISCNGVACTECTISLDCDGNAGDSSDQPQRQHQVTLRYELINVHTKGLLENGKWLSMLEDARMVIFCVALSDYDESCEDASGIVANKMLASKCLFEKMATCPTFKQMDFLLVLNKFDLLEQKIEQASLTSCEWFSDFNPVTSRHRLNSNGTSAAEQAFHYIAVKFKRLFSSLTGRRLYVTLANDLDANSIDKMLKHASEITKWEEEKRTHAAVDVSTFSTEMTEPSTFSH